MSQSKERDYVLGTHDEELERLGVQHRAWRPVVLDCWQKAGITVGKRVLDIGAGPGYAAIDLAEYGIRVNGIAPGNISTDMNAFTAPGMNDDALARCARCMSS